MPWEEKTVEETRAEFIARAMSGEQSKSALCREYGISRPTAYKWIERYLNGENLSDHSRRPFHSPQRIDPVIEAAIIQMRRMYPALGAKKIHRMMLNDGVFVPPAVSTINAVLKRNGLICREASLAATPYKRFEKEQPNQMWQADFKGNFTMQNGQQCHPLSILDDHSRMCLCADAKANQQRSGVQESFQKTFETYGLPSILLCDNGHPWGASQSTSITKFEVWLMQLGILPIHIRIKHPQTQGKVERFNGSYKRECLKFYTPVDLADAQRTRQEYMHFYNHRRPHEALSMDVPAEHYTPSTRNFPSKISSWEYEAGGSIRSIKSSGYLTIDGQGYYLSEGLGDQTVMIYPSASREHTVDVVFRQFRVAQIDVLEHVVISRRIRLLHDDPRFQL